MRVVTAAIIKGGTGKSTTICALAQAAKAEGLRVLVVDLDPQGNASRTLGARGSKKSSVGSYEVLTGQTPLVQAITNGKQNIPVVCGDTDLAAINVSKGGALNLRKALETVKNDFDFVFIDTPPYIGELVLNALAASDTILIPLETDVGSISGLQYIGELIQTVRKVNRDLSFIGVLMTRYDGRPKLNQEIREVIEQRTPELGATFLGCVRNGIAIKEAHTLQRSLYEYARKSNPAKDYQAILKAIIEHNF